MTRAAGWPASMVQGSARRVYEEKSRQKIQNHSRKERETDTSACSKAHPWQPMEAAARGSAGRWGFRAASGLTRLLITVGLFYLQAALQTSVQATPKHQLWWEFNQLTDRPPQDIISSILAFKATGQLVWKTLMQAHQHPGQQLSPCTHLHSGSLQYVHLLSKVSILFHTFS